MNHITKEDVSELRERLRRTAHLLRLEGDYVAAQEAERQLASLSDNPPLRMTRTQQKSAA